MSAVSEELQEKLRYIRICKKCRAVGRSLIIYKKKHCPLCGNPTKRYKLPAQEQAEEKSVIKVKDPQRSAAQKNTIKLITSRTSDFDCAGSVSAVIDGPVVTEYEFTPDRFTRIGRLKSLSEDLALALAVDTVTIRRIPGRPCLGIAIPNPTRLPVTFESCKENVYKHAKDMDIPLNFGILSDGSPYVEDLTAYPHMLVAGSTGTGKSVLLNQLLTSLLLVRSPKQLQMVLIDPKTVELFPYRNIPHLLREPVSTVWRAIDVLEDIVKMMKSRTEALHDMHVNSIKDLNENFRKKADAFRKEGKIEWASEQMDKCWPYILVVMDEISEIVLEEKKEFIKKLAGISQMARAAGICVIASTQRPSVDVLPGKVKVNFLARAAFRMPAQQDSKTVLNFKGAETLLGKGDLFVLSPDKTGLQRIHVAHCRKEDREPVLKRVTELGYGENGLLKDFAPTADQAQQKRVVEFRKKVADD